MVTIFKKIKRTYRLDNFAGQMIEILPQFKDELVKFLKIKQLKLYGSLIFVLEGI